jgi:hypothetical protein
MLAEWLGGLNLKISFSAATRRYKVTTFQFQKWQHFTNWEQ